MSLAIQAAAAETLPQLYSSVTAVHGADQVLVEDGAERHVVYCN